VTRKSVIQLARQLGYTVEEVPITVTEAMDADEIFTTGTAVVVSAVGSLTYRVGPSPPTLFSHAILVLLDCSLSADLLCLRVGRKGVC
jgi:branched-subunit amino acid aminotransferase/4-amino-4-deoxychorismate lyase